MDVGTTTNPPCEMGDEVPNLHTFAVKGRRTLFETIVGDFFLLISDLHIWKLDDATLACRFDKLSTFHVDRTDPILKKGSENNHYQSSRKVRLRKNEKGTNFCSSVTSDSAEWSAFGRHGLESGHPLMAKSSELIRVSNKSSSMDKSREFKICRAIALPETMIMSF